MQESRPGWSINEDSALAPLCPLVVVFWRHDYHCCSLPLLPITIGRQPAMTKLGVKRVHTVRGRGGNLKYRALRLENGNFAWRSESELKKVQWHLLVVSERKMEESTFG